VIQPLFQIMNKPFIFLIGLLLPAVQSFSQMYILNEDFNGASGTTPPVGWNNIVISGGAADQWHFDNPGERMINYPITAPFAIFDSDSTSSNGIPEEVALQTPMFDASTSNYILLHFAQTFYPGNGGSAKIEAFDGEIWHEVITYTSATSNPSIEIVDLSAITGGVKNAMLRFIWSGNGSGFWAVDNIRIYASLPLDGGVVSLDSPESPVVPGLQNVEITLGNFGYNTITTTTIDWTANGVAQPPYTWNGSMGFGQIETNVVIGTFNFQDPVLLKIWQSNPNGQSDLNSYNDTVTKYLVAALCGTYTIGGNNPDFETFSQAADVLNIAGITCPVTFLVRDGIYYEQFILRDIQGTSAAKKITFRSESGDSTLATIKIIPGALKYESMILLDGSRFINFQNLGLHTGSAVSYANNALLLDEAQNINIEGCYFEVRNQFDFGVAIQGGSRDIEIDQNRFESISARAGAINISAAQTSGINIAGNIVKGATDWGYSTIKMGVGTGNINVTGNDIEGCYRAIYLTGSDSVQIRDNVINNSNNGVYIDNFSSDIEISGNRFTNIKSHPNAPEGTGAITVNKAVKTYLFNNFIHTTGDGPVMGIMLEDATICRVNYNSINITNDDAQGRSNGIKLTGSSDVVAKNNIFNVLHAGAPVYIAEYQPQLDFDYNDYYNLYHTIGYYNGDLYTDLASWVSTLGMDMNSLSVTPFYTSMTNLSINQALLNNAGTPVAGIAYDIDGALRNSVHPDIGAKEYNPCSIDAGINAVTSPENPLNGGIQQVRVLLQNQGTNTLSSVTINWMVNEANQTPSPWSGSLGAGANLEVAIGNFNFQPGIVYTIKAWTIVPNNTTDCNNNNDTISSRGLAVPLCGTYTIGGSSPDFITVREAVNLLNLAGVTCPVTLLIRDGIYNEQFEIKEIPGTSAVNTVTFRSVSGDSTLAVIHINPAALKFESMIYIDGSQHIIFQELGFITGSDAGYFNNAILMEGAKNIAFKQCYFEAKKESDLGIGMQGGSQQIEIKQCRFECISSRASAITLTGEQTRDINIEENIIKGATEWGYVTIRIGNDVRNISVIENHIDRCLLAIYLVNMDSALIQGNVISNSNEGIFIDDLCTHVEISGNRLIYIQSHENAPDGTSAIFADNATEIDIFNNFIHTAGDGPVIGINLQNTTLCRVNFNSLNITNIDNQGKSKGILMQSNSAIIARNNVFYIAHLGTPVYISSGATQLDFNHNDYYSFDQTIGYYNGNRYTDLAIWTDSVSMDMNSLSVKPFFTTETDLSINQALLNNAGVVVAGITQDIDGSLRDPVHPDIGAKEYNLCANDAGINAILSPENPLTGGTAEVRVVLQNQGTNALSGVKINWMVNDAVQTPYSWSGNLAAGANAEVTIGDYEFQNGNSYILKIWTSEPNNTSDCNHNNDTLSSPELAGPLCGTYTIGGTSPDFTTFGQAASVLNSAGISCPVTFLVRDGIYIEKFILEDIKGSSEANTITFRSESGDSTLAALHIDPEALKFESMIYLDGSQHIKFKGLGLFTGSELSNANYAILMEDAKDIELSGCYIEVRNETDYGLLLQGGSEGIVIDRNRFECTDFRAGAISISGSQTQNINITGNIINGSPTWGYTLIKMGSGVKKVNLTDNKIERSYRSVYMVGTDSIRIIGNTLKNTNDGIYVDNQCSNIEISRNRIMNIRSHQNAPEGTNGIFVQNSTGIDIVNNFVQTAGDGPVLGINLISIDSCRIYFNSVNTTNNDALGKSKGLHLKTSSEILARNNIFSVKNLGLPIHIDVNVTNFNLDYNNYYNPSGIIGKVNEQVFTNLSEWGQTINGDANSKVVNPYFKADTIPLPFQRILNGAGITIFEILYDIDEKLRNRQAPDIGCMEFFVDYGILDLLSPTLNCYHSEMDSVIVYIRQFGDVPFNDLKVAYQLDNGPIHIDTIQGPLIEDVIHTFGTTENISAPGDYRFRIWLINTLDDNINNDTLIAMRYSKPPPVVTMDLDNFCTGWEVHFTGQATVAEPYYIDHYEWLFGDGETSGDQNPVHTYLAPGTYNVACRAYSNAGCYGEIITPVFIDPDFQGLDMNPQILADPLSGYSPLTVNFTFTANAAESWTWHFTESDSTTNKFPTYTFHGYGNHVVMLEVQSGPPYYCIETAFIEIFVDTILITIEANNVFTPNGDGYNDFFEIKSVGVKEMNVNIFNQWGNKMYEIEQVDGKWDGNTTGGAKAPDGTYFYALTAMGYDNLNYDRKGSVLLLRHGYEAFPNPVTDKVKIKIYDPLDPPVSISVYSVFGQLAYSEIVNDPENLVIDISHLSSGIYILKLNDGMRNYFARIIKN